MPAVLLEEQPILVLGLQPAPTVVGQLSVVMGPGVLLIIFIPIANALPADAT